MTIVEGMVRYKTSMNRIFDVGFSNLEELKDALKNKKQNIIEKITKVSIIQGFEYTPSKYTNLENLFANLKCDEIDLSSIDFSYATTTHGMFNSCTDTKKITLGSNTKTIFQNVEDMSFMFNKCINLININLEYCEFANVTNISNLFSDCSSLLEVKLAPNTTNGCFKNVTNMSGMFLGCRKLTEINLDIEDESFSKVTSLYQTFKNCTSLKKIITPSYGSWSKVSNLCSAFEGCENLKSLNLTFLKNATIRNMNSAFLRCNSLDWIDITTANIINATTANIYDSTTATSTLMLIKTRTPEEASKLLGTSLFNSTTLITESTYEKDNYIMEYDVGVSVLSLKVEQLSSMRTLIQSFQHRFERMKISTSWDIEEVDLPTDISYMFANINVLNLNLIDFNVSKVTNFKGCFKGAQIGGENGIGILNMESWDISNGVNFKEMFMDTTINGINCDTLSTINATDMSYMFSNANIPIAELKLNQWNTRKVTTMESMFEGMFVLTELNINGWMSDNMTNTSKMFKGTRLVLFDAGNFKLNPIGDMRSMFENCTALETLNFVNTTALKNGVFLNDIFKDTGNLINGIVGDDKVSEKLNSYTEGREIFKTLDDGNKYTLMYETDAGAIYQRIPNINELKSELDKIKEESDTTYDYITVESKPDIQDSDLTSLSYFFSGITCGTLNVSINTDLVEDMSYAFYNVNCETLNINYMKTNNVTSFVGMFGECKAKNIISEYPFVVDKGKIEGMFKGCYRVEDITSLGLSDWNTGHIENLNNLFYNCINLKTTGDIKNWDVRKVKFMKRTFAECNKINTVNKGGVYYNTVDITNWNNVSLIDSEEMFNNSTISVIYMKNFRTSHNLKCINMFQGLNGGGESSYTDTVVYCGSDRDVDFFKNEINNTGVQNNKYVSFYVEERILNLFLHYKLKGSSVTYVLDFELIKDLQTFIKRYTEIEYVKIEPNRKQTSHSYDMTEFFKDMINLKEIDISLMYDNVFLTGVDGLFEGCTGLSKLNVNFIDITNTVTSAKRLFKNCSNLYDVTVINLNVDKTLREMDEMFYGTTQEVLNAINMTDFNTDNVVSFKNMFTNFNGTYLFISHWDTSSVTNMNSMFKGCENIRSINIGGELWKTENVTDMEEMFAGCISTTSLDLRTFVVGSDTSTYNMFDSMKKLKYGWAKTQEICDLFNSVYGCTEENPIFMILSDELMNFTLNQYETQDMTDVTNSEVFLNFESLIEYLYLYTGEYYKLEIVEREDLPVDLKAYVVDDLFSNELYAEIDLSRLDLSYVVSTRRMFKNCDNLKKVYFCNGNTFSNVVTFEEMFAGCWGLHTIDNGNSGILVTSKTISVKGMFDGCRSMSRDTMVDSIRLEEWDTSNVTSFENTFREVDGDISPLMVNFDTSNVITMRGMFQNTNINEVYSFSNWNISNVIDMSYMFYECRSITEVNLISWFSSNIKYTTSMFYNCSNIEYFDFSGIIFDTLQWENSKNMFYGCKGAEVSNNFARSETSARVLNDTEGNNYVTFSEAEGEFVYTIKGKNKNNATISIDCRFITEVKEVLKSDLFKTVHEVISNDEVKPKGYTPTIDISHLFDGQTIEGFTNESGEWVHNPLVNFNMTDVNEVEYLFANTKWVDSSGNISQAPIILDDLKFTEKIINFNYMFEGAILKEVKLFNDKLSTDKIEELICTFKNSTVERVYMNGVKLTNLSSLNGCFDGCTNLREVQFRRTDFKNVNLNDISYCFRNCGKLEEIDLSCFKINNDNNIFKSNNAFSGCYSVDESWGYNEYSCNIFNNSSGKAKNVYFRITEGDKNFYLILEKKINNNISKYTYQYNSFVNIKNEINNSKGYITKISMFTKKHIDINDLPKDSDMEGLFCNFSGVTNINVIGFDFRKVTSLARFCASCSNLETFECGIMNTESLTNIEGMFSDCTNMNTIDMSKWDLSKVENMNNMFYNCDAITSIIFDNVSIPNVSGMCSMCAGCKNLEIFSMKENGFKYIVDLSTMFSGCTEINYIELDLCNCNTIKKISGMFKGCNNILEVKIENFLADKIENYSEMFMGCQNLRQITGLSDWKFAPKNTTSMFENCWEITHIDWKNDTYIKGGSGLEIMDRMFYNCIKLKSVSMNQWECKETLTSMKEAFALCEELEIINLFAWNPMCLTDISYAFKGCVKLVKPPVEGWRVNKLTNVQETFSGCRSIMELDLNAWSPSNLQYMYGTFSGCTNIEYLKINTWSTPRLSSIEGAFHDCSSLLELNLTLIDTTTYREEEKEESIFKGCTSVVNSWGRSLADCEYFNNTIDKPDNVIFGLLSPDGDFKIMGELTNGEYIFTSRNHFREVKEYISERKDTLLHLILGSDPAISNERKPISMYRMFNNISKINTLNIEDLDLQNVTDCSYMVCNCPKLTEIYMGEPNTTKVNTMAYMYAYNPSLVIIDGINNMDVKNVNDLSSMFESCVKLRTVNIYKWDLRNATNLTNMFKGCISLVEVSFGNVKKYYEYDDEKFYFNLHEIAQKSITLPIYINKPLELIGEDGRKFTLKVNEGTYNQTASGKTNVDISYPFKKYNIEDDKVDSVINEREIKGYVDEKEFYVKAIQKSKKIAEDKYVIDAIYTYPKNVRSVEEILKDEDVITYTKTDNESIYDYIYRINDSIVRTNNAESINRESIENYYFEFSENIDVEINRNHQSVNESFSRLCDCKSLEDIIQNGNGFFNIRK